MLSSFRYCNGSLGNCSDNGGISTCGSLWCFREHFSRLWLVSNYIPFAYVLVVWLQASRVLQLERNSLEHFLHHFRGITANKEYQNADWRLRPLPEEMPKYGREDTHYLLHIYDLMKQQLISKSSNENDLLLEELYAWRDKLARQEDESTGYILPNRTLLEIAKEMPDTPAKLRRLVKSKHSMVERHLNDVSNLII